MNKLTHTNIVRLILVLVMALSFAPATSQEAKSIRAEFNLENLPDTLPPRVTILAPQLHEGILYRTSTGMVTLSGKVFDESQVMFLAIDSKKIPTGDDGTFSTGLELYPGENEVRIVASDIYYNLLERFLIIDYVNPSVAAGEKTGKQ